VICRAFDYIHRVCDCKYSCARKTAVFPHGDSGFHHPTPNPFLGRGEPHHVRGGGEGPSRGVEFASRQARTEGCNPCELSQLAHARGRGNNRCRVERDGASAVAKPGAIQTAAHRSKGGGDAQLDKRPCEAVNKAAQRHGKRRRSPKAPPPRGYLNRWTSAFRIVMSAAA
jgi:hypothetical protein